MVFGTGGDNCPRCKPGFSFTRTNCNERRVLPLHLLSHLTDRSEMSYLSDLMIEREEYAQAARRRCKVCGERLQQGEDDECYRHTRDLEKG